MSVGFGIVLFLVFFILGGLIALSETTRRLCLGASCSLPILGAIFLRGGLDRYIEHAFLTRWDPLFEQRSASSGNLQAEQAQMIALTENPEFLVLPIEEQRAIVESLHQQRQNRKAGS